MNSRTQVNTLQNITLKTKTLAAAGAVIAAVLLPQLLHLCGRALNVDTALGEIFLPMHLPIIVFGLLMGPWAGIIAGILAPIVSYLITGMPLIHMLPFIIAEIGAYGLSAGILGRCSMNIFAKTFVCQISGRVAKAICIIMAFYIIKSTNVSPSIIISSIITGLPGILLQLLIIPAVMRLIGGKIQ